MQIETRFVELELKEILKARDPDSRTWGPTVVPDCFRRSGRASNVLVALASMVNAH